MKNRKTSSNPSFFKIILLGDSSSGKGILRQKYMGQPFRTEHSMTIGGDFSNKDQWIDKIKIYFHVWDLASQDAFHRIRTQFYRGAMGGIIVFDLGDLDSFKNSTNWIEELWNFNPRGIIPVILLGNQRDEEMEREVTYLQGVKLAQDITNKIYDSHGITIEYLETSTKTGKNIDKTFELLGKQILGLIRSGKMKFEE